MANVNKIVVAVKGVIIHEGNHVFLLKKLKHQSSVK